MRRSSLVIVHLVKGEAFPGPRNEVPVEPFLVLERTCGFLSRLGIEDVEKRLCGGHHLICGGGNWFRWVVGQWDNGRRGCGEHAHEYPMTFVSAHGEPPRLLA